MTTPTDNRPPSLDPRSVEARIARLRERIGQEKLMADARSRAMLGLILGVLDLLEDEL